MCTNGKRPLLNGLIKQDRNIESIKSFLSTCIRRRSSAYQAEPAASGDADAIYCSCDADAIYCSCMLK